MSIQVLLADDHRVLRLGMRALLSTDPTMEIVGEAANGREAVESARELSPDVILMDITMPDLNGALATRQILAEQPGIKVVALSMHSDGKYVSEMLSAGASAYLLKSCDVKELIHAINLVCDGQKYLTPEITNHVIKDYMRGVYESCPGGTPELSQRQQEVLQLLSEGLASKEIAARLHISVKTVTTHRQDIMSKLNIRSVAELTKYAIRAGLTSLES
ncbi:MAG: response regulator transcription factor [Phycisphaerae bacterium]|nr:response regulator transcription factor [Phycisphaerae bacterium]